MKESRRWEGGKESNIRQRKTQTDYKESGREGRAIRKKERKKERKKRKE